eukprot:scaffold92794_cov54-Phaeocystis_antarctica.AAC.2
MRESRVKPSAAVARRPPSSPPTWPPSAARKLVGAVRATAVQQPTVVPARRPKREAPISSLGVWSGGRPRGQGPPPECGAPRAQGTRCRFWSWSHGEGLALGVRREELALGVRLNVPRAQRRVARI